MAYSTQRAVSNGTLVSLPLSIDYFDRTEISVFFAGIVSPLAAGKWAWVGTTDKTIAFTPAVANGVEVLVQRNTALASPLHEYTKGAAFIAETLDDNFKQALRIAQEAREGSGSKDVYNDLDFHGYVAKNIGPAVNPGDAVSLGQYQTDAAGAGVAKTAAQAAATAAAASQADALVSKNAAATSATNAGTSETNALTYKNAANTSAGNASTSATAASTSAGAASTSATNAGTSETNALSSKNAAAASAASIVRDGSGGVAGLTGYLLNLYNAAGTIKSAIASIATVARTWTFPDKSGTVAMTSDILDATISTINGGPLAGFRNRLINGDMRLDQRYNGGVVAPALPNAYTVDRLIYSASQTGKFNFQRNANTATPPAGFPYYAGYVVAATFAPAAGDFFYTGQRIEGQAIADFAWGTAAAKAAVLSFWVQSSVTGTHSGSLVNGAFNYCYPFSFAIPVANTWTYIQIQVPGPTAGTWPTDTALGLSVNLNLGCGATYLGAAGAWSAANLFGVTGAVKVVSAANGSTMYLTGTQLELGTVATPFEQRPLGMEIALCRRYYRYISTTLGGWTGSGTSNVSSVSLDVVMRASPTFTLTGSTNINTTGATVAVLDATSVKHTSTGSSAGGFISEAIGTLSAEL